MMSDLYDLYLRFHAGELVKQTRMLVVSAGCFRGHVHKSTVNGRWWSSLTFRHIDPITQQIYAANYCYLSSPTWSDAYDTACKLARYARERLNET